MSTLTHTTKLIATSCWCGIPFAIPENLHTQMHDGGNSCHCPNGHSMYYDNSYKDRLAAEQAKHDQTRARLDAEKTALTAQKAATTREKNKRERIEKRVAAGVCPVCNRTFQQLARHMKGQHPEYPGGHDH